MSGIRGPWWEQKKYNEDEGTVHALSYCVVLYEFYLTFGLM